MILFLKFLKDNLRIFRNFIKKHIFRFSEAYLGIHITPVHFYSPIPKISELKANIYTETNICKGLEFNVNDQLNTLKYIFPKYLDEYTPPIQCGLSQIDAFVLYSLIRIKKPKLFIEIGSGESTKISLSALEKNESLGIHSKFQAIEPYPKKYLKEINNVSF